MKNIRGALIVLGANGIFNPFLLQKSGIAHAELGRGLVEQVGIFVDVHLPFPNDFSGSTVMPGHGYIDYAGSHRRVRAGSLMETYNSAEIRDERGKWRNILRLKFVYEGLRRPENFVRISPEDPDRPEVVFSGNADYTEAGMHTLPETAERILSKLPVEKFTIRPRAEPTEAHIIGTTPMGSDPQSSVVDSNCILHQARNVMVLGSSVFPTAPPANPTLTLCALALRAADSLFRSEHH